MFLKALCVIFAYGISKIIYHPIELKDIECAVRTLNAQIIYF